MRVVYICHVSLLDVKKSILYLSIYFSQITSKCHGNAPWGNCTNRRRQSLLKNVCEYSVLRFSFKQTKISLYPKYSKLTDVAQAFSRTTSKWFHLIDLVISLKAVNVKLSPILSCKIIKESSWNIEKIFEKNCQIVSLKSLV